ncbi:MAG: hypothetical protein M1830_007751, partial [Pleopsidium flavum]
HHQERSTVSTRSAAEDNGVENLRNRNGEKCVSEDVVIQSEAFHQALSIAKAEPLRLIFGSTPPPASTAHPSENGSRGTQGMLGVRSTVTEASDDLEDAIVKGSDEMEWEKLVGVVELPKHAKSSSLGPAISVELAGLHQTNVLRPHDPRPDSNEAPQSQHDFQTLQVDDQVVTVADNNTFLKRTTRAQTEDEVWMKFLEIDGGDEEDDEEDHSPASYHRRVPESILAHASSTSFATTLTESSPFPNAKFASDNTGSPRTRGAAQNSPSAQASSADLRSVLATAHTSSPDPLAGGTYSVPSIASPS